ncbi:MAG: SDR family NAD(P)-dependent oxidoreductase [Burkholderiales bacterium]|nr:SDR family NAD(P)-dependent oxidoreductase [Burkholderiales bacterium]
MNKKWTTALISGGGSGIGLRLAEELLGEGARVALIDLKFSDAAMARLVQAAGGKLDGRVWLFEGDMRNAARIVEIADQAMAALGGFEIAINSAGVQNVAEFGQMSEELYRRVVEINLFGSRNFAAAVWPHLQRGSQLALMASLAGIVANFGYAAYNSSKFGVVGLAGALRIEGRTRGIDVSVICPPEIDTPMVDAEKREAPRVTMKLKEFAGTLALEPAVREIIALLRRREFMVIPGARARLTRRLAGWFPALLRSITDDIVRKTLGT